MRYRKEQSDKSLRVAAEPNGSAAVFLARKWKFFQL